jgi:RimJ/RimL family protein N-acetyltransferase
MTILETERLSLRELTADDVDFIFELLNEPAFLANIGYRGADDREGALAYIENGPRASYARNGFGLYLVVLKDTGEPIGMCGLLKRDTLEDVDIGYAFLERFWGKGYASEAAAAVMTYGREMLKIPRIVAIIAPHNDASGRVLEKIGLRFDKIIRLSDHDEDSKLYVPK